MKRIWMLFVLLSVLAACSATKLKPAMECSPLSKTDFSKQPKDIMAELDSCMDSKKFKQAAEKFYALASSDPKADMSADQPDELKKLQDVISKKHLDAAIESLDMEIKRIHQDNSDLCKRIGLFSDNNLNEQAIKNDDDRALIEQSTKSFSDNKKWKQSLSELLRCQG